MLPWAWRLLILASLVHHAGRQPAAASTRLEGQDICMHYVRLSHPPQLRAQGSPAVIVPTGPSLPLPAVGADKLVYHAIITLVGCPYSLLPSETKAVSDALSSMMYDPWTFSSQQGFKSGVEPTISTTNPTSLCATAADFPVPTAALCSVNCQGWVDAGAGSTVAPETYTAEGAICCNCNLDAETSPLAPPPASRRLLQDSSTACNSIFHTVEPDMAACSEACLEKQRNAPGSTISPTTYTKSGGKIDNGTLISALQAGGLTLEGLHVLFSGTGSITNLSPVPEPGIKTWQELEADRLAALASDPSLAAAAAGLEEGGRSGSLRSLGKSLSSVLRIGGGGAPRAEAPTAEGTPAAHAPVSTPEEELADEELARRQLFTMSSSDGGAAGPSGRARPSWSGKGSRRFA
ncbi:hypothetical protein F751_1826 [Auxenochlorella protothecoides]|uniref:Uncharacterized protein n=1 Tax=Auxenochlorella protothecoides TaxID=3075 RepID=A0A087SGU3_AUXPR|nr:hypothetical protein F751_1826 [Auxenochlorella protothecoides]KFM24947.1 hypothetical protein F751_1826 [Auxenochlorella protothecoides]